jgi:hypothetical protein
LETLREHRELIAKTIDQTDRGLAQGADLVGRNDRCEAEREYAGRGQRAEGYGDFPRHCRSIRIWLLGLFLAWEGFVGFAAEEGGRYLLRHRLLDLSSQGPEMFGKLAEQLSLLWIGGEVSDHLALGKLNLQLLQMGLHVLHGPPLSFRREGKLSVGC